jgi:mannose-1-phosphate guanylyltransferase
VESPHILGTGGGLKNAAQCLEQEFVVVNGDILCDVNLSALLKATRSLGEGPAAAMALRKQEEGERFGIVASDSGGCVVDLVGLAQAKPVGSVDRTRHFTGIHALNQEALSKVPEGEACIVRTAYCEMLPQRQIAATQHTGLWVDLGTPERYLAANLGVLSGELKTALDPLQAAGWALSGARESGCSTRIQLHPSARLKAPFGLGKERKSMPALCWDPEALSAKTHILKKAPS